MERKKILFFEKHNTGIYYYRILTPAIHLDEHYSKYFDVEINNKLDIEDEEVAIEYFSQFDIIQIHQFFHPNLEYNNKIFTTLKEKGVKIVVDIDDYWFLDKSHPLYESYKENNTAKVTIDSINLADYVTTTTESLANEIKLIKTNDNVLVVENAIDINIMNQFQDNRVDDDVVRIVYLGGSTHKKDVELLDGLVNMLNGDYSTKGKFKFINVGWDVGEGVYDLIFNKELLQELQDNKLLTNKMLKQIRISNGNIYSIEGIPEELINKYDGVHFDYKKRDLTLEEIPYYHYEKIFTDDYRNIKDEEYLKYLKKYIKEEYKGKKNDYERIWTEPTNRYAKILDYADIVLAPLVDSHFNSMKSPLKLLEAWSRKLPVVCSNVEPYNIYGKHMENCILVRNKRKYWFKEMKKLILDKNLRKKIGNNLHKEYSKKYTLDKINKKRYELYENI